MTIIVLLSVLVGVEFVVIVSTMMVIAHLRKMLTGAMLMVKTLDEMARQMFDDSEVKEAPIKVTFRKDFDA